MEELKQNILRKFGSLSEFCRQAEINRGSLDNYLKKGGKTLQGKAIGMVIHSALRDLNTLNGFIKASDRERLEKHIIEEYDGKPSLFADLHCFDRTMVYSILHGKRKRKTDKVNEILRAVKI